MLNFVLSQGEFTYSALWLMIRQRCPPVVKEGYKPGVSGTKKNVVLPHGGAFIHTLRRMVRNEYVS